MKKTVFKSVSSQVNFPQMERELLESWYENGIVEKYLHKNDASEKRFSFMDGPITANNPMGVHHAWGRTYKDLWQRFYNMRGYKQRFQNGFDCQGLWVEVEVEKELKLKNKKEIENLVPGDKNASIVKFVDLCKERVLKYARIQTEQSRRLGYFMDWDHSYFTMSEENNYMIWHFLKVCHEQGWIYKGRESVPWCPRCETAISQHEMLTEDYKEATHESIYLELPLKDYGGEFLLVWTTTPWTIPANIAVAIDEDLKYSLVEGTTGDKYWIAKEAVSRVFGKDYKRIVKTVKGQELVGLKYRGPFDNLEAVRKVAQENPDTFHTVIATDKNILPITTTEGTGLVHTAVSAGTEDFKLGKKYNLPMIPVIADNADYLPHMGFLAGLNAKINPRVILDYLLEREKTYGENWVFSIDDFTHRYPACWRCKTELVWKVAEEWYIAMDKPSQTRKNKTLREMMIEVAQRIRWIPKFGLDRELDWLNNMHDWLISKKNRYWGLALPIYECEKCENFEVIGSREELEKRATSGWEKFAGHTPHKPWIDEVQIKCSKCGGRSKRIGDVGNPWLDAGIVPYSTLVDSKTGKVSYAHDKEYWQEWFPADFITESFPGQFKNWFYALIAMSSVLEQENPFKTVFGYGTLLAEDGRPMHKSWGNMIEFNEGADKIGVDVMRWMFVTHDPEQNILLGYKKADETRRQFHLLLWNVYNFFVTYANADKWSVKSQKSKVGSQKSKQKHILDRWILSKLHLLIRVVTESLEEYDAFAASNALEDFVTDLSQWYVRRSRDRVGPTVESSDDKDEFYNTLYEVLVTLAKLLAPFMPFLSDFLYTNLTGEESVHLAFWPVSDSTQVSESLEEEMRLVREIVELIHSQRKAAGVKVRQPLPSVSLSLPQNLTEEMIDLVKAEVNVKEVKLLKNSTLSVKLDTNITSDLKLEGDIRELIRQVQLLRKEKGYTLDDRVVVTLPSMYQEVPRDLLDYIRRETLAKNILWGESLSLSTS